jgi:hypothetical protein
MFKYKDQWKRDLQSVPALTPDRKVTIDREQVNAVREPLEKAEGSARPLKSGLSFAQDNINYLRSALNKISIIDTLVEGGKVSEAVYNTYLKPGEKPIDAIKKLQKSAEEDLKSSLGKID